MDRVTVPVIVVIMKMGFEMEATVEALNECKYVKHIF